MTVLFRFGLAVLLAMGIWAANSAQASRAVRRTIVGCVVDGVLISGDSYRIRATDADTRAPLDLSRHEGRRIRYRGDLLPGDIFMVRGAPAVLGLCGERSRR